MHFQYKEKEKQTTCKYQIVKKRSRYGQEMFRKCSKNSKSSENIESNVDKINDEITTDIQKASEEEIPHIEKKRDHRNHG